MPVMTLHGWAVWELYHDKDDEGCGACAEVPCRCDCGGLLHIQISEDVITAAERLCDACGSYTRFSV